MTERVLGAAAWPESGRRAQGRREGCREGGEGKWWELPGCSKASREEININSIEE